MNGLKMQSELNALYAKALSGFKGTMLGYRGTTKYLAAPFFIDVTETAYPESSVKLVIVGQQTNTWKKWKDMQSLHSDVCLRRLLEVYRSCEYDKPSSRPFGSGSYRLRQAVSPEAEPKSFVWTNLIKLDDANALPNEELMKIVRQHLYLLPRELKILKPHSVAFLTGINYDWLIEEQFPEVKFVPAKRNIPVKELARVVYPTLPYPTYRTYHPGYLNRSGKLSLLDELGKLIRWNVA